MGQHRARAGRRLSRSPSPVCRRYCSLQIKDLNTDHSSEKSGHSPKSHGPCTLEPGPEPWRPPGARPATPPRTLGSVPCGVPGPRAALRPAHPRHCSSPSGALTPRRSLGLTWPWHGAVAQYCWFSERARNHCALAGQEREPKPPPMNQAYFLYGRVLNSLRMLRCSLLLGLASLQSWLVWLSELSVAL